MEVAPILQRASVLWDCQVAPARLTVYSSTLQTPNILSCTVPCYKHQTSSHVQFHATNTKHPLMYSSTLQTPNILSCTVPCYKHQTSSHDSVEITNKMQPCNRIYYSTVHWRLNMFRAAYHSSSGALTVFAASGLHTHVVTCHSQVWVPTQTWLLPVTTCVCKPEATNTVRAPDDERYAARNMLSLQWTVE